MSDFFEIEFLEVHKSKSGDAIAIRCRQYGASYIHVVDGGYASTGQALIQHIDEHYGYPSFIDNVVVTHPDQDHAEGVQAILNNYAVGALWMLLPWNYIDELLPRFARFTNPDNLKRRLRETYPYLAELEQIAQRRGIPIREPFQTARIGPFTVMAPSRSRYLDLVVTSTKTPEEMSIASLLSKALFETMDSIKVMARAAWGDESFPSAGCSNENEMSVIQFARIDGKTIVLTADAGRDGLNEAAEFAPFVGLSLPGGVDRFQIPHHGGRHNVSTETLDRWFGPRLPVRPKPGEELFTAIVSAAREDPKHPRKVVKRAFIHRGAQIGTTENGTIGTSHGAPARAGWGPAPSVAYPENMDEEDD